MSAYEVNQLFEAIKAQYEVDGTIDPQQKAQLLEEMKKFAGGDKFVYRIREAFQQIESSDRFKINAASAKHTNDRDAQSEPSGGVDENGRVKVTGVGNLQSRQNKLRFDVALKVYNLFQVTCHVEKSPAVVEKPEFFSSEEIEDE